MLEYSYIAAALALIGTVATAFLSYRGSRKAAELNTTATTLDAQLRGWKTYSDELTTSISDLRTQVNEERGHRITCENKLWKAERRISVLERRLGIESEAP